MLNLIQPESREFMVAIKAGSIAQEDSVHWEMDRLILNRYSPSLLLMDIRDGQCWSGSVALNTRKLAQEKALHSLRITSSRLLIKPLTILPVRAVMKN